jgi:hypothetical protein
MKQAKKAPKIFTVPAGQFDCGYVDPVTGDVLLRCSDIDMDKFKDPELCAAIEDIEYTPPEGDYGPATIVYETYDNNGNLVDPLAEMDPSYKKAIDVERKNNVFIASAIASLQEERDAKKAKIDKECRSAISDAIIDCLSNTKLLHQSKDNTYDRDALVYVADGLEMIYSAADKAKAKVDQKYNTAINETMLEYVTQANIHRDAVVMCTLVEKK